MTDEEELLLTEEIKEAIEEGGLTMFISGNAVNNIKDNPMGKAMLKAYLEKLAKDVK